MKYTMHAIYAVIIMVLGLGLVWGRAHPQIETITKTTEARPEVHWHADIKVLVDGSTYNFNQDKFMREADNSNENVHFHNHDGDVLHIHQFGLTWGDFFKSIGGALSEKCLSLPNLPTACSVEKGRELKFWVNGVEAKRIDNQPIVDLERVLIYYGGEEGMPTSPLELVSNKACSYSGVCAAFPGMQNDANCTTNKPCHL